MKILPVIKQYEIINKCVKERLDINLPKVMNNSDVDMWLIVCKEYNEDPVFKAVTPANYPTARRVSMLAFIKTKKGIERISLSMPDHDLETLYKPYYKFNQETQGEALNRLIEEYKPKNIGINYSEDFAYSDGMSLGCYQYLLDILDPKYQKLLVCDEMLAIKLMEVRTPTELKYLDTIAKVGYGIIEEVYTSKYIKPGKTTCKDLEFALRQRVKDYGLSYWFEPTIDLQRAKNDDSRYYGVIEEGDLIHCDFGINYLNMCTDVQRLGYIAKKGETKVPDYLLEGMKNGNAFQDIVGECLKEGKTGNQVFLEAIKKAKDKKLKVKLYSHPCNIYGHGPGPTIGLYNQQTRIPVKGEIEVSDNTVYALELNVTTKLNNQDYTFYLEETVKLVNNTMQYTYPGRDKITFIKV